jgi:quercetin dioxygenase-like cupin family protein
VTLPSYGLLPGDALSVIRIPPLERVVKANAESTGGVLSAWESTFPTGAASPLHVHQDAAEFIYLLDGDVSFYLDGKWFEAKPGAFVAVPKGAPHGFRVRSSETRILFMFSPAAMLGMWEEIAALGRPVDDNTRAVLARKYHMEVLGPLPEM